MSGHSHWSTIQRHKGVADAKRGQTFTKVANNISLAARLSNSGDPENNPRLRTALEGARAVNMPKENIQRAIDRGLGKLPGQTLEEVIYEGFGPLRVAFLLEGITDNKLRTLQEVRNLFDRAGGNLGSTGSTVYMFDKKGEIRVKGQGGASDDELLTLIDLGAQDVEDYQEDGIQYYSVYIESPELFTMSNKITQSGFSVESSEIVFRPNLTVELNNPEEIKKIIGLIEKLEENDDIQKVYANFTVPDGVEG